MNVTDMLQPEDIIEQGKGIHIMSKGREEQIKPRILTMFTELILNGKPPTSLLAVSSALIAIYLRFYQFSFALARLLQ